MKISLDYKDYGVDVEKYKESQLKLPEENRQEIANVYEIILNFCRMAISAQYPKGVPNDQNRIFAKIQRKVEDAEDAEKKDIPLNDYELAFLCKAFSNATWPTSNPIAPVFIEDMLIVAKSEATESEKTEKTKKK